MKIRVAIISPLLPVSGYTIWNVRDINAFMERFLKKDTPHDSLIIGEFVTSIYNFQKHETHIATFNTVDHTCAVCAEMMLALSRIDAPKHRTAFHNVKLDVIDNDRNPLRNPDGY